MKFVELMEERNRMCRVMDKCENCPIHDEHYDECWLMNNENGNSMLRLIEERVATWAAEHPRPQTWFRWLEKMGIIIEDSNCDNKIVSVNWEKLYTEMPLEIAEKLNNESEGTQV